MTLTTLLILALLVLLAVVRLIFWLQLPHRCPSCDARFDETQVRCFSVIGGKDVYFCAKCVNDPVGRLHVNGLAFAAKGFSAEEIALLHDLVHEYKR